jgi:hypothetical protein
MMRIGQKGWAFEAWGFDGDAIASIDECVKRSAYWGRGTHLPQLAMDEGECAMERVGMDGGDFHCGFAKKNSNG